MATLQVRDLPEDIYRKLTIIAEQENRSITQQTIVLLQNALGLKESNKERRKALLQKITETNFSNKQFADPVTLIREDRDR